MSDKLAWYVSRSSGWVAFALLACTVLWGVLGITRLIERKGLPRWLLDVHKHLAFLTIVFTAVHLGALVADNFMRIGWREIMVPFALDYRSGAVAWGIVSMYLLVAIQVSSWLRHRMPRRWWRGIHFLSYPVLWMTAMHGLRAGTDAGSTAVRYGVIAIVGLVSFATLMRVFTVGPRRRRSDATDTLAMDDSRPDEADHPCVGARESDSRDADSRGAADRGAADRVRAG